MAINPKKGEMPTQAPAVRARNFDEVALGYTVEMAAEEAEKLADEAAEPSLMDGSPTGDARLDVYFFVARIEDAAENGSMDTIRELRHKLNIAVLEFAREQGLTDLPRSFSQLLVG